MEMIRISDRKLKIMMTPSDMSHFELNTESLGEDSVKTHRAFRLLLRELKSKIGFDADDKHLSVQYFPSREGGCEMFICNLLEGTGSDSESIKKEPTKTAVQLRTPRIRSDCFRRDFAYRFENLESLLAVCRRLAAIGYICESSAYRDHNKNYFLFLTALSTSPFSIPDEIGFIVEYGKIENASAIRLYILEHGQTICADEAIIKLSQLS